MDTFGETLIVYTFPNPEVEMAIASRADHFLGFGDDAWGGPSHASMPSVVVQMIRKFRLRAEEASISWFFSEPKDAED